IISASCAPAPKRLGSSSFSVIFQEQSNHLGNLAAIVGLEVLDVSPTHQHVQNIFPDVDVVAGLAPLSPVVPAALGLPVDATAVASDHPLAPKARPAIWRSRLRRCARCQRRRGRGVAGGRASRSRSGRIRPWRGRPSRGSAWGLAWLLLGLLGLGLLGLLP